MALTKEIEVGTPSHVMGDQWRLPITVKAMQGVTEVFSRKIDIDYKTNQTIADAFAKPQVVEQFQAAIDAFKQQKVIEGKTTEIAAAAQDLLDSLIVN